MTYFGALNINYKLMFCFSISDRIWCLERDFISTVYQECYKMCTEFPAQFRSKPRLFENAWYIVNILDIIGVARGGGVLGCP